MVEHPTCDVATFVSAWLAVRVIPQLTHVTWLQLVLAKAEEKMLVGLVQVGAADGIASLSAAAM